MRLAHLFGGMTIATAAALALGLALGNTGHAARSHVGCHRRTNPCRVLFVGDSYTYVNRLPAIFEYLALAGGHSAEAEEVAEGGESLANHVDSGDVKKALASAKWNVVVLQEQSEIPASERLRQTQMYPAARQLVGSIQAAGAQPMFFVTWAHRDGWPENGLRNYASMQAAVDFGYLDIARNLHVAVAQAGDAWSARLNEERHAGQQSLLWASDGSHPTRMSTYLVACVFYAAIFRESPIGLSYDDGIPAKEAAGLQAIASEVVLGRP
jgi:hypothetical protein